MFETEIQYLAPRDYRLLRVIETVGDIDAYKPDDPFVFLVYEIIGQMLSDKVRDVLIGRFNNLLGGEITPERVLNVDIKEMSMCGMSLRKCTSIKELANSVLCGDINLNTMEQLTDDEVTAVLTKIKGIGQWTSKMFLLFYLQRKDILPVEDAAFMQAFKWLYGYKNPSVETVKKRCSKWSPYSSVAARYMYRALDTGLTKIPIHVFLGKL